MNREYIVVDKYDAQYSKPIKLFIGEKVVVGERYSEDPEWKGWIWCENSRGEKGWVLERVLKIDYDMGVVLENYDAKELTAEKGEIVKGMGSEAGWILCSTKDDETGWLPERNLKQLFGD